MQELIGNETSCLRLQKSNISQQLYQQNCNHLVSKNSATQVLGVVSNPT